MNRHFRTLLILALSGVLILSSTAYAQITEVEPNHPCSNAQNIGAISLPFTQYGSIDSTDESPDEGDYFRFTGTPGEWVEVVLEGEATGKGTLSDPNLSFLGSTCDKVIAFNDNIGENNNSRLILIIPADGVFIMAANGGGTGTYQMTISQFDRNSVEIEPNHPCSNTQNIGAITLPFIQNGSLDSTDESIDVDSFRFTGAPGEVIKVDLEGSDTGKGTLFDPYLEFFDSSCNLIASNDNGIPSSRTASRLTFIIPSDGVFILAASSNGGGPGTYQMTISHFVRIGSISGQVLDAVFGDPLPGDVDPFAAVTVYRCNDSGECWEIASQPTDSEGRFRFSSEGSGNFLEVGTYKISTNVNGYYGYESNFLSVAEDEDLIVENILVQPVPLLLSGIQDLTCYNAASPGGGICRYRAKVTNHSTTTFYGKAWSLANLSINSFYGQTVFQVGTVPLKLKPNTDMNVQFEVRIPAGRIRDHTINCFDVYVGQNPNAFFNPVFYQTFCIDLGPEEDLVKVISGNKAKEILRQMNGNTAQPTAPLKQR